MLKESRICIVLSVILSGGTTGSASEKQSTNDRKVAGSRPKVMYMYHSVDR